MTIHRQPATAALRPRPEHNAKPAALAALESSLERKSRFFLESTAALTGIGARCAGDCARTGCREQRCETDLAQLGARVLAFVLAQRVKEETSFRQCRVRFDARVWEAHRQDHAALVRSVTEALATDPARPAAVRALDLASLLDRHWASHHVDHDEPALAAIQAQLPRAAG